MGIRGLVKKTVKTATKDGYKARSAVRGLVKNTVKTATKDGYKARSALRGGVSAGVSATGSQIRKGARGLGKQIPGYGEFNVTGGKPKTNRGGNAIRKIGKNK